ncbi:MAG: ribosomal RNA small subunit methyltransferase A [Planctomycetes bacterium]|nr:ribosomal RNA small subunit methyltransferase A [Planctomycetota bacterium]
MSEREPFSHYLDRMAALGFRPSSTLGQNFLLDPSLHRCIADAAAPSPADVVVEIGVGLGFLTRELVARAGRVVGVELDRRLLAIAREELAAAANLTWVEGDALGGDARALHPAILQELAAPLAAGGRRLVVANLPYAVSGPLLAELVAAAPPVDVAVVLVQKELAQRVAAAPGTADYGGLSVAVQAYFDAAVLRLVPPSVFRPRPKVMSAIVRLQRRPDALAGPAGERREFLAFVRSLFRQRRKALRTTLPAAAAAIGGAVPAGAGEGLLERAEALAPATVVEWWQRCRRSGGA